MRGGCDRYPAASTRLCYQRSTAETYLNFMRGLWGVCVECQERGDLFTVCSQYGGITDKEYSGNIQHMIFETCTKAKQTEIMFLGAKATRDR